jgi:hypothetical protein
MRPLRGPRTSAHSSLLALLAALLFLAGGAPAASARMDAGASPARLQSCPTDAPSVHRISGTLHTCRRMILDQNNRRVRFLGLEIPALGRGGDHSTVCGHWHNAPKYIGADVDRWGFNSVELMISWSNLEPTGPTKAKDGTIVHHWDQDYLAAIDTAVKRFTDHGVAVVLMMVQSRWSTAFRNLHLPNGLDQACGWGMPAWLYPNGGGLRNMVKAELNFFQTPHLQDDFGLAWETVVSRYVDNPLVVAAVPLSEAYDILAVPFPGTENIRPEDLALADFYERMARWIRTGNQHLLIFYWDQQSTETKLFALTRKPVLTNAVYGAEFYSSSWYPRGEKRLATYLDRATSWGVPMAMGEFSAYNYTLDGYTPFPGWRTSTRQTLAYARKHGIGWSICCYGSGGFQTEDNERVPKPGILPILKAGF